MNVKYALLFLPSLCFAEPPNVPNAMVMATHSGAVTLYDKPCTDKPHNKYNFDYYAEATDGAVVHKGCWDEDGESVHIWFYNEPDQPFIASFGKYYFKPKSNL